MKKKDRGLGTALLGLSVILILGIVLSLVFRNVGTEKVRDLVNQSGIWAPLIFIILHAATVIISPFGGGGILTLTAGPLFGPWFGMLYFALGAFLGSAINFWVARLYGQKIISNLIGEEKLNTINKLTNILTDRNPIILVPLLSTAFFNFFCYAAGLTNIKFSKFYLAVTISTLINTPLYIGIATNLITPSSFTNYFFAFLAVVAISIVVVEEYLRRNKNIKTPKIISEFEEVSKEIKQLDL